MTTDIDDVIHATGNTVKPVLVAIGTIAGKVVPFAKLCAIYITVYKYPSLYWYTMQALLHDYAFTYRDTAYSTFPRSARGRRTLS